MLSLVVPRRIFDNIQYNRCREVHFPYDGSIRARIADAVEQKHPGLDIFDFPNGVVVNYHVTCPSLGDSNPLVGRCTISILSDDDGGCPDDGLPIAVITFM